MLSGFELLGREDKKEKEKEKLIFGFYPPPNL